MTDNHISKRIQGAISEREHSVNNLDLAISNEEERPPVRVQAQPDHERAWTILLYSTPDTSRHKPFVLCVAQELVCDVSMS